MDEEAEFWDEVRATMGTPEARSELMAESERFASTLTDGVDPDEDWSELV